MRNLNGFLFLLLTLMGISTWAEQGPATAYISALAIESSQPETLFAATNGAGVYRRDGLQGPWLNITPKNEQKKYYSLESHKASPGLIITGGENTGLWASRDDGGKWTRYGLEPDWTILDIATHPQKPSALYVLTPEGLYYSPNFRDHWSWELVFDYSRWLAGNRRSDWPDSSWKFTRFQKITVHPKDPNIVLLGARWEGGYFQSHDAGQSWEHHQLNGLFRRVDELRVDPFQPDLFYGFTHHQGLFKSYNGGKSWAAAGTGLEPQIRTPHYAVYLLGGIAFSPSEPGLILSGSDYSTWLSEDHGESWSEVGRTLTCEFVRATAIHPENPDILFAGSNIGVFQSFDRGRTWTIANTGFPLRSVLKTLDVEWKGQSFRYALVKGTPSVFRRSLEDEDSQYHPLGWLVYDRGIDLNWNKDTQTLLLETESGTLESRDGGFRWSVPSVELADRELKNPDIFISPIEGGPNLAITNAAVPNEEPLLDFYKRPPFISIQLVEPGYPENGSVPLWSTNWERQLLGSIEVPEKWQESQAEIYVEVRDFHYGTRVGRAPYQGPNKTTIVRVEPLGHIPQ